MNKVRVLVDAEYTYMNPALSLVTMAMMKKFNKDGTWIWNTYQCYLKATIFIFISLVILFIKYHTLYVTCTETVNGFNSLCVCG